MIIKPLFFIALILIGVGYFPMVFAQPQVIGQVVWVKGTVKAISSDNKSRILQRRDAIYLQDQITTNKEATGEIVFTDGGVLALRSDTSILISEYKYTKESTDKYVVDLVKGGFRTITGAISKAGPEAYQVNTPVATIGIRGTHYSAYYKSCGGNDSKREGCGLSLQITTGSVVVENEKGQVVLKEGTNQSYARVGSSTDAPSVTSQQPGVFQNDVAIQPASFQGPGLGPVTDAGNPLSNSVSGPGPAKPVSGFCLQ